MADCGPPFLIRCEDDKYGSAVVLEADKPAVLAKKIIGIYRYMTDRPCYDGFIKGWPVLLE